MGLFGFGSTSRVFSENENTGLKDVDIKSISENEKKLIECFSRSNYAAIDVDRNLVDARNKMRIPYDEKTYIVFKRRTLNNLIGKEIFGVVTRKNIYFLIKGETRQIPLENICMYRISSYIGTYSAVDFEGKEIVLYEGKSSEYFKKGSIGCDLEEFFKSFQIEWHKVSNDAKKQIDELENKVIENHKEIHLLDDNEVEWVNTLLEYDVENVKLREIKLRDALDKGNFSEACDQLHDFNLACKSLDVPHKIIAETLLDYCTKSVKGVLDENIEKAYYDAFDETLLELVIEGCDDEDERKIYLELIDTYKKLLFYIKPKYDLTLSPVELFRLSNNLDKIEKEEFLKTAARFKNKKMYEAFVSNEVSTDIFGNVDAFGLTPIHYCFLKDNVDELNKESIPADVYAESTDETLRFDYAYSTWAAAYGPNAHDIAINRMIDAPKYQPFKDVINQLERRKNFKKVALKAVKAGISKYRNMINLAKNNYSSGASYEAFQDKIEQLQENLMTLKQQENDLEDDINSIEKEIEETWKELTEVVVSDIYDIDDQMQALKYSTDFIDLFIHAIYYRKIDYSDILQDSLSEDAKLYYIHGTFILMTERMFNVINGGNETYENHSEKTKKQTNNDGDNKKESKSANKRPYGSKWFSEEAYKDPNVLKQEYRALAKKYHPDCNPNGKQEFLEIQQERAVIMQNFDK